MALSDSQTLGASPQQTYRFEIYIGSRDLSHDLYLFNIITSVQSPYQTFELGFVLDQNDIILDKIFGQDPIKLAVILETETGSEFFRTDFELIFLDSASKLTSQSSDPSNEKGIQIDKIPINFTAISKKAYTTMNYHINDVFHATSIGSILQSLVTKTGAQLVLDRNGINAASIAQALLPPLTLYQSFSYLNQLFGLYDGVPVYFCSHDNKVNIKNLTKKINTSDAFTIYQLALDSQTDIYKDSNAERTYINWGGIQNNYKANATVAYVTPTSRYILKPADRLFHKIIINVDEFTKDYGIIHKDSKIFYDKTTMKADSRMATYISQTGNELSQSFINSTLSRHISDLSTLDMTINRNFNLLNFMDVGEAINFITQTDKNVPFSGKYILRSSLIGFSKLTSWEASASISLIRSNKTSN